MNTLIDKIYSQEFKKTLRGYDPVEVDEFLDGIIAELESLELELSTKKKEFAEFEKENFKLKLELLKYKEAAAKYEKKRAKAEERHGDTLRALPKKSEVYEPSTYIEKPKEPAKTVSELIIENETEVFIQDGQIVEKK